MATTCAKSNRWVRGGVGALVGAIAGGLVGFGVFMATLPKYTGPDPGGPSLMMILAPAGGLTLGAGLGAYIGARKPQCP
jgi:ABC-type transporter Mla subunit MlaD